jgi:uncharacterized protein YjbI with pentapeptide repeats
MANREHLAILKKGVQTWNRWRGKNTAIKPDLKEADLNTLDLGGANLKDCDLSDAGLSGAELSGADLRGANLARVTIAETELVGTNLTGASLFGAEFLDASLSGSNLVSTDLSFASLVGVNFWATDLSNSKMFGTIMGDSDLSTVIGLETVRHDGPSTIGIDTIYLSKGKIPEVFLRGAGVPDEFITYMKSLVANPIEFYSCFISYSTKDQEFAERLHGDLQNKNVRCWFAPHDVHGGKKLHEQIDEAIRVHEKVLLILSESSMNSEWVKTEIAKARKREVREKKQVLFPVRLVLFEAIRDWECFDADAGKDSAREIREYFIPDFSEWKEHDKYRKAFERLLGDLKAGEKREAKD